MSDINTRQALIDEKVLTLEERLLIIHEQIEQMPDLIKKTLTNGQQRSSLPTLAENITVSPGIQIPTGYTGYKDDLLQQQQPKHTYLHPNDAALVAASRPSWSASNVNTNPNYSSSSSGKQYLTPNVLRTTSFDTWSPPLVYHDPHHHHPHHRFFSRV